MKSICIAALGFCAGSLFAQDQSRVETRTTTTTKTTWNGTLVDDACQSTRTEQKEFRETDQNRTVTTTTRTETVACPVTTTTTTFGLMTSDGRYVRFDNPSNARVVEIVKRDHRSPARVTVIGTANGEVATIESLEGVPVVQAAMAAAAPAAVDEDIIFDVRYNDDRGKLIVTSRGVSFEDLSNAKHSRTWTYAHIKELKRDGRREVKIEPYSGDSYEFKLDGRELSDSLYKLIGDRIVAARTR